MLTEEICIHANGMEMAAKQRSRADVAAIIALHGWLDNAASFNRLPPALQVWAAEAERHQLLGATGIAAHAQLSEGGVMLLDELIQRRGFGPAPGVAQLYSPSRRCRRARSARPLLTRLNSDLR